MAPSQSSHPLKARLLQLVSSVSASPSPKLPVSSVCGSAEKRIKFAAAHRLLWLVVPEHPALCHSETSNGRDICTMGIGKYYQSEAFPGKLPNTSACRSPWEGKLPQLGKSMLSALRCTLDFLLHRANCRAADLHRLPLLPDTLEGSRCVNGLSSWKVPELFPSAAEH